MKKKLLVLFILLALPLVGAMSISLFDSDFDKFAKKLYRQLGHSSEPHASEAVLAYLEENGIDDPFAFFEENMESYSEGKESIEDAWPHEETREKLRAEGIVASQSFSNSFKLITMIIAQGELRVHVYEKADGGIVLKAYLFLHTL